MAEAEKIERETWLDLSEAAKYLGVHFTTLRRWADAGQVPYIRTPGGRRRFSMAALAQFANAMVQTSPVSLAMIPPAGRPLQDQAIERARQSVNHLLTRESWLGRMSGEQRERMKGTGRCLMALLLQYSGRSEGGDVFLEEGQRIMDEYSQVCSQLGFSLEETVHVFQFFRRPVLESVYETGWINNSKNVEGLRLYHRTIYFLDALLLQLINSYLQSKAQISD